MSENRKKRQLVPIVTCVIPPIWVRLPVHWRHRSCSDRCGRWRRVVTVYRTLREDDTLRAEFAGYEAYTERVRYRLVPAVW